MKIKAGETVRFDCNDCSSEFEITFEPKAKGLPEAQSMEAGDVEECPFCGSDDIDAN